jgi:RNA polymerase sigma factor for flagellar operon FliA
MAEVAYLLTRQDRELVQRIARRVYNRYTPAGRDGRALTKEELFHYGIIGLLEARKKFSPENGAPWPVFAAYRIEGEMLDHLRKAPIIRLPHEVQRQVRLIEEAGRELERQGEETSDENLARFLDWPLGEISRLRALVPTLVGITEESPRSEDRFSSFEGVVLEDSRPENDPREQLLKKELASLLERCLEKLPEPRDRFIVKARRLEDVTLRELAEAFDCSIETIRKREQAALLKLRSCLEAGGWQGT